MEEKGTEATWFERVAAHRRWLPRLNAGLLAGWFGAALLAFPRLPERIPMHFMPGGSPTRWEAPTLLRWLALPLVALAIVLFLPLLERAHHALNRSYAPASPAWTRVRRAFLDLCATHVVLAFAALHLGSWMVATGRAEDIPAALLVVAFGAMASILLLLVPLHRAGTRAGTDP